MNAEKFNYESNTANGSRSHAEGFNTTASGNCSHAEGSYTTASGTYSHAEGNSTIAFGSYSHAEGSGDTGTRHAFIRTSSNRHYTSASTLESGEVFTDKNGIYAKITSVSGTESPYTYAFDTEFITTEGGAVSLYEVTGVAYGGYSHTEGSDTTASGD